MCGGSGSVGSVAGKRVSRASPAPAADLLPDSGHSSVLLVSEVDSPFPATRNVPAEKGVTAWTLPNTGTGLPPVYRKRAAALFALYKQLEKRVPNVRGFLSPVECQLLVSDITSMQRI